MASNSKLLVVIGATGTQGGSVVETFLQEPGWTIRGLTRNPGSAAAQALQARGVEMVAADVDDVASLLAAFAGAHTIFSMTDFWTGFFNPANQAKLAPGQTLMEWAHDYELQQGKNILAAANQTPGLQRLIYSALSYASKWSRGKYTHVYHYDAEGRAVDYATSHYPELMEKTSVIQIGMYLTNTLWMSHYQPKKDQNGVYVFSNKFPANCKVPLIAPRDDTGPFVKALVSLDPGKNLLAYRETLTFAEYADVWGRVLGVKTKYVALGPDEPWGALPDTIKLDIEEGVGYFTEFGADGGDPSVVHPKDLGVPIDLGTVADWIGKQDWSAVL
ncbi:hypothetical protein A1O3_08601 [Capronia epimyces CBS 606.96]|uniref:NmrA-like domain-containing protein n=1 Tax=Capronia epimyces CBS 606.96 TaxID=1182542 RepID=W9XP46_9EURO|nr:uncharacterized protein A1O3_08601 [Capronia epimyces CBS 606.96]EXJ79100.1 hypothetical protein A1O3_08601 [Capronia epimyces CBS 606.96]